MKSSELDLGDRASEAVEGHADGRADDPALAERRVEDSAPHRTSSEESVRSTRNTPPFTCRRLRRRSGRRSSLAFISIVGGRRSPPGAGSAVPSSSFSSCLSPLPARAWCSEREFAFVLTARVAQFESRSVRAVPDELRGDVPRRRRRTSRADGRAWASPRPRRCTASFTCAFRNSSRISSSHLGRPRIFLRRPGGFLKPHRRGPCCRHCLGQARPARDRRLGSSDESSDGPIR